MKHTNVDRERENWADTLRTIACIGVIMIHTVAPIVTDFNGTDRVIWTISNMITSTLRFCVPIFLMLAGAFLLPRQMTFADFLKRRFSKIIYPFLFWSAVYIAYEMIRKWSPEEVMNIPKVGRHIVSELFHGAAYHFWYIYLIIGLYLFVPVIGVWARQATQKEMFFYLTIWYLLSFGNFPPFDRINNEIDLRYFSGYMGFMVLGYALSRMPDLGGRWPVWLLMALIGSMVTTISSHLLTLSLNSFKDTYYNYLTPNVIMGSAGLFLLFRNIRLKGSLWNRFAAIISRHSYGIYLSHIFFLSILSKFGINSRFIHPAAGIPITLILATLLSVVTVRAIARLPFGSRISG